MGFTVGTVNPIVVLRLSSRVVPVDGRCPASVAYQAAQTPPGDDAPTVESAGYRAA
jgi:hypothetical protein